MTQSRLAPVDDVVDIGEVALHAALAEYRDRLSLRDQMGELVHRHLGSAARTVDGEETQRYDVETVEVVKGEAQLLPRLLGHGVGRDGAVDPIRFGEGQLLVGAIHRGGGREENLLYPMVPCRLEERQRPNEVDIEVTDGVGEGSADARPGRQMDERVGAPLAKKVAHQRHVADVPFD